MCSRTVRTRWNSSCLRGICLTSMHYLMGSSWQLLQHMNDFCSSCLCVVKSRQFCPPINFSWFYHPTFYSRAKIGHFCDISREILFMSSWWLFTVGDKYLFFLFILMLLFNMYFRSLDAEKNNASIIFAICCCVFVKLISFEVAKDKIGRVSWYNNFLRQLNHAHRSLSALSIVCRLLYRQHCDGLWCQVVSSVVRRVISHVTVPTVAVVQLGRKVHVVVFCLSLPYLTLPYFRGGQVVTPAQHWGRISSAQSATPM